MCAAAASRSVTGRGRYVKGKTRRNVPKGKYLAHVGDGGCYGEGVVHHTLKTWLTDVINERQKRPDGFMGMPYVCPDPENAPNCIFKGASGQHLSARRFPELEPGHHYYDLLKNLDVAKSEHWLGARATRADIVGLDQGGNPLWVIEIKRKNISDKAVKNAKANGYPLFVVDVTAVPEGDDAVEAPLTRTSGMPPCRKRESELRFMATISMDWYILLENATRSGALPRAVESYNAECQTATMNR